MGTHPQRLAPGPGRTHHQAGPPTAPAVRGEVSGPRPEAGRDGQAADTAAGAAEPWAASPSTPRQGQAGLTTGRTRPPAPAVRGSGTRRAGGKHRRGSGGNHGRSAPAPRAPRPGRRSQPATGGRAGDTAAAAAETLGTHPQRPAPDPNPQGRAPRVGGWVTPPRQRRDPWATSRSAPRRTPARKAGAARVGGWETSQRRKPGQAAAAPPAQARQAKPGRHGRAGG